MIVHFTKFTLFISKKASSEPSVLSIKVILQSYKNPSDTPLNENVQIIQVACALHPAVLSCHYPHSYSNLIEIYQ